MSKITLIALDLDAVVVNFSESVYRQLGLPFNTQADLLSDERIYELAGGRGKFWARFGHHNFFEFLDPYPWAKDLVNVANQTGIDWIFLSKSTFNDGVSSGKSAFIRREFPKFQDRLWLARGSKARMSGPGRILIDDKYQNCFEFQQAKGWGYHWAELHPSETTEAARRIEELKLILTQ